MLNLATFYLFLDFLLSISFFIFFRIRTLFTGGLTYVQGEFKFQKRQKSKIGRSIIVFHCWCMGFLILDLREGTTPPSTRGRKERGKQPRWPQGRKVSFALPLLWSRAEATTRFGRRRRRRYRWGGWVNHKIQLLLPLCKRTNEYTMYPRSLL